MTTTEPRDEPTEITLEYVFRLETEVLGLTGRLRQIVALYKQACEDLGGDSELLRDAILGGAVHDLKIIDDERRRPVVSLLESEEGQ